MFSVVILITLFSRQIQCFAYKEDSTQITTYLTSRLAVLLHFYVLTRNVIIVLPSHFQSRVQKCENGGCLLTWYKVDLLRGKPLEIVRALQGNMTAFDRESLLKNVGLSHLSPDIH